MGKAIWYYDINCLSFIMLFESTNCRLIKIDHIIWDIMNQNNNSGIIRENKNIKDKNNNRIINVNDSIIEFKYKIGKYI